MENAIVVITADHGEEFWEHGALTHGTNLYNENVRIPLILLTPGHAGGQRIEDNVSLIDVAPTLLDLAGLPRQPRFEGRTELHNPCPASLWKTVELPESLQKIANQYVEIRVLFSEVLHLAD